MRAQFAACVALAVLASIPAHAQTDRAARRLTAPPRCFVVTFIARAGRAVTRQRLYQDGMRWRLDTFTRRGRLFTSDRFNGNRSGVVMGYAPEQRFAMPTYQTIIRRLRDLATTPEGQKLLARYHIPEAFVGGYEGHGPPLPQLPVNAWFPPASTLGARQAGAVIAGRRCVQYRGVEHRQDGHTITESTWLDIRTGFLMKWDWKDDSGPLSPVPPTRVVVMVTSLTAPSALPGTVFEIPRGTAVSIPRIFPDVRLPRGCRLKPLPESMAAVGIGFGPPAGGPRIKVESPGHAEPLPGKSLSNMGRR